MRLLLSVTVAALSGAAVAQRTGDVARIEALVRELGGERGSAAEDELARSGPLAARALTEALDRQFGWPEWTLPDGALRALGRLSNART